MNPVREPGFLLNLHAKSGGQTLGFSGAEQSSATKGETVADTARVVSCYSNIIAMRHPKEGAPLRASMFSKVPVINAGDGGHNHPTQTLIDLLTIRQRMGRLDHLPLVFAVILKFGRTVHSLVNNLVRFFRKSVLFYLARGTSHSRIFEGGYIAPGKFLILGGQQFGGHTP